MTEAIPAAGPTAAHPSPSHYMRELKPGLYSDSGERTSYAVERAELEYQLETVTSRNQTQDFEIFCRKLCERAICPNLRPQTGPEGGGDSKADSETYAQADEIATLSYIGTPSSGRERWAFAFSAKKTWARKVRDDVEGLIATGRPYDRIICVTAQFARAKDRAKLEDQLAAKYGIPVTIHDRSWIVTEIMEKDRKDLAVNYLRVGRLVEARRLGPNDYSRSNQLEDIETAIADPAAFDGMKAQRVSEAILAAELSRQLERPRYETEGRWARAIRFADADGTHRQKLEARYENMWTAFWWWDDIGPVQAGYDAFEAMILDQDHVKNIQFLANLASVLFNSVAFKRIGLEESQVVPRMGRLRDRLQPIAANARLPNAALEAETLLAVIDLELAAVPPATADFDPLIKRLAKILKRAESLAEFDAERLIDLIRKFGTIMGNRPAYGPLVEQLADFVAKRRSEGESARILVQRAEQLGFDQHFEIIRLLGTAARRLTKKEYSEDLLDALPNLALAYRSAGLFWSARATCIMAAATAMFDTDEDGAMPPLMVPMMGILASLSLEIRHVPDFLSAIELMVHGLNTLPLTEESRDRMLDRHNELDLAFASNILHVSDDELAGLSPIEPILHKLGLKWSRSSLLYMLGQEQQLRDEGHIPPEEDHESVRRLYSTLADQPASDDLSTPLILHEEAPQRFETRLLGLTLIVQLSGTSTSIQVAQAVLGSAEALMATAIPLEIAPHTEHFTVEIVEQAGVKRPEIMMYPDEGRGVLIWPEGKPPATPGFHATCTRALLKVTGSILAATCYSPDFKKLVSQLYDNHLVGERMTITLESATSYHRVFHRWLSRLPTRDGAIQPGLRPALDPPNRPKADGRTLDDPADRSHRDMAVRSVINQHLWNKARWGGTAFFGYRDSPPLLCLTFRDGEAAEKIFTQWHERFGARDEHTEIHLAIIRRSNPKHPAYYTVLITSGMPGVDEKRGLVGLVSRFIEMTPTSTINLDNFLKEYARYGCFWLAPAVVRNGTAEPTGTYMILKRGLVVRDAADVQPHDLEAIAIPGRIARMGRPTKAGQASSR